MHLHRRRLHGIWGSRQFPDSRVHGGIGKLTCVVYIPSSVELYTGYPVLNGGVIVSSFSYFSLRMLVDFRQCVEAFIYPG